MVIYKMTKRFDPQTGTPLPDKATASHYRCDFTGLAMDEDCDPMDMPYPRYDLAYGDQDPCFGSGGDEFKLSKDFKMDVYSFLAQPYTISLNAEEAFVAWAAENRLTVSNAFRQARAETARRLLDAGEVTVEQLGG